LTVLIGEGDAGKSAYLRAIRAAFLNEGDDLDIRKNADDVVQKDAEGHQRCTVDLTFEDGVTLTWWKDLKKGGCYLMSDGINKGMEYTKTAGEVPEEVAEYLGIVQLEVDANTVLTPQLSDQHDQPWLLWETGSKRARVIGKATRLDMIVSAQMTADKELRMHNKEVATAQAAIETADLELATLGSPEELAFTADLQSKALEGIVSGARIAARARELLHLFEEADSRAQAIDVAEVTTRLHNVAFGAGTVIQLRELETRFLVVARVPEGCQEKLAEATTTLNQVTSKVIVVPQLRQLEERFLTVGRTIEGLQEDTRDGSAALALMKATYTEECEAAGVCENCGGLLDHEECKA
ncbi:hypothetical protein LCGC14_2915100, partial [marine sediment metagenome]